jgi:hypothetical protein
MDPKHRAYIALGLYGFAVGHTYLNDKAPEPIASALQISSSASDTGDSVYISDTMLDTDISFGPALHAPASTSKSS